MKIVTLNIRHGGGRRIPGILDYLRSLDADALVLTEFRENSNAPALRTGLAEAGLVHFAGASVDSAENSVCIISRLPFAPRTYPKLETVDRHRLLTALFDDLAIHGVYFSQNRAKAGLLRFLASREHELTEDRQIIIGDFNTGLHHMDEAGATFHCTGEFMALSTSGLVDSWRSRNPDVREHSWFSSYGNGFRIDHVFATTSADASIQAITYDHVPRETGITDHSAMVVELG